MIDYETYCRIHHLHQHDGLGLAQIARALALDERTVGAWLAEPHFRTRRASVRTSKLDPYKRTIRQMLETHPYSAVQIFQRLHETGYTGGLTIVKDYVATVRPRRSPAAPGPLLCASSGSFAPARRSDTRALREHPGSR